MIKKFWLEWLTLCSCRSVVALCTLTITKIINNNKFITLRFFYHIGDAAIAGFSVSGPVLDPKLKTCNEKSECHTSAIVFTLSIIIYSNPYSYASLLLIKDWVNIAASA